MHRSGEGYPALARLEPGDGDALGRFFSRLSRESLYRRFLSPVRHPEQTQLDRVLHGTAVVGMAGGEIVGVANYTRLGGSDAAEIAVVVEDAWQGRGLGTRLLTALADRAREAGIRRFEVASHADNRRALALLRRLCPRVKPRISSGVLEASVTVART
jgi:RimJ/RimL family protein N-acetyltransferase